MNGSSLTRQDHKTSMVRMDSWCMALLFLFMTVLSSTTSATNTYGSISGFRDPASGTSFTLLPQTVDPVTGKLTSHVNTDSSPSLIWRIEGAPSHVILSAQMLEDTSSVGDFSTYNVLKTESIPPSGVPVGSGLVSGINASGLSAGLHRIAYVSLLYTGFSYEQVVDGHYVTVVPPPSVPSTFTVPANDNNGAYSVSWSASAGATSYTLQRRTNGGGWSTIQNTSATSKSESGLGNASYEYRVSASNSSGSSAYSPIKKTDVAITPGVPSSISNPSVSYSSSFTVSWGAASGSITKYDLNKRFNGGGWTSGYDGAATSKGFSGQAIGSHEYAVRACKTTGSYTSCSAWRYSSATNVILPSAPGTPNAPSSDNNGAYAVGWGSVSGATSYELQRQTNGGSWSTIQNTGAISKSESGLGNATYGYRVRACSGLGCSAYSGVDSTDVAITPGVPASISNPVTNYSGSYSVNWGTASGSITKYDLNKRLNGGTWTSGYDGTATNKAFSGQVAGTHQYAVRACKTTGSYTSCSAWKYSGNTVVSAPTAPSTPNAPSNDNNGAYSVSWSGVGGATHYDLQRQTNGGSWSTIADNTSTTSKSESGLGNGTYGYRVRACSAVGCSAYSAVDSTDVAITPGVPVSITAPGTSYSGSHTVNWGSSSGSITVYELYQQKDGGTWTLTYSGTGTSTTLSNLAAGSYIYRVRARKTTGSYSTYSGYRTSGSSLVTSPVTPSAPNASDASSPSIALSWNASTGASFYILTRTGPASQQGTILVSAGTSLVDTGPTQQNPSDTLTEGTYTYTLQACSSVGCSSASASVQVLVDYVPSVPPSISASSAGALTGENYTISWGASSGVITYYEVQERINGPSTNVSSGTSYTTSKANPGGIYHYRVRACNADNCSDWRQFASVRIHELLNIISPPAEETSNLVVGTSPYEASVTPGGNASLTVPIKVAPGTNGFQPNFAISYLSGANGTRGLVRGMPEDTLGGAGWSMSGVSSINVCRTGLTEPIERLCLDGEPLILVSGSYGATGSVYHTLKESYVRVEQKEIANRSWYEVKFADGRTAQYGATEDSYVANKLYDPAVPFFGAVTQWSVNKATDAFGNTIDYAYNHAYDFGGSSIGSHYLLSATYDNATVEFGYEWFGTTEDTPDVLLKLISIKVGGNTTREYRLVNDSPNEKIQECGFTESGSLESCLKPLIFSFVTAATPTDDFAFGLSEMVDGLGVSTKFTYSLLSAPGSQFSERPFGNEITAPDTENLAVDKHVVTELRESNGLGGDFVSNYAYHGLGLNSTKNWGFLGFYAQRTIDQQSGIVTYLQRHLGNPLLYGEISAVHQYDAVYGSHTEVLSRVESQYDSYTITHGNGNVTEYAYGSRNTEFTYEGGQLLGAREEINTYAFSGGFIDDVTTLLRTAETVSTPSYTPTFWGDVPTHTLTNILNTGETVTGFTHRTSGSEWLIGFADAVVTSSYDSSGSVDGSATLAPHSGSLRIASATRFPNDPLLELITSYTYDSYGNITDTTVNGANVTSRTASASNFLDNRYPQTLSNAEGHTTSVNSYDLRFGTAKQVTDPNGQVVSQIRDAQGRVTSATSASGVVTTSVVEACNGGNCSTVSDGGTTVTPAFRVITDSVVSPQTIRYYDALGRVIRTEVEAFTGSNNVLQDTFYDNRGRVAKSSLPYLDDDTPQYLVPSYDLRNRVTSVSRPDGGSTATTYSVNGAGDRIIVTVADTVVDSDGNNPEVQTKRSEFDLLGNLVSTTDAVGASEETSISYTYWPDGNMKTATVDGGSDGTTTTSFEYDAADNRTKLTGPNVGVINSTFTALGQVDTTTDNKGQLTSYSYDLLGRVTGRTDADGSSAWVWDSATNGTGLLASRTDNNGFSESYTYQLLNGVVQLTDVDTNITGLNVLGTSSHSYSTTNTYDSFGRPLVTSYPAGLAIKREYNSRGYLDTVKNNSTGVALQTFNSADAFGNVTDESFGNGVGTLRAYDPTSGRLTDIDTANGSTVLQNLEYTWRSNGILESRLARPDVGNNTLREETFEYDALNRLTKAKSYLSSSWQRDLDYQYNRLGNLTSKTSTQTGDTDVIGYNYGNGISTASAAGPHAVTSATIDGVLHTLNYDANGAIKIYDRAGSTTLDKYIEYNAASQPTKIVVGTGLNDASPEARDEFLYDPDGSRYFKKSTYKDNGQTKTEYVFYVGDYEHSYTPDDNDTQEVHKTSVGGSILHMEILHQTQAITTEVEYLHRDHMGSVETITDENGNLLQRMAFEPFGNRKDSDWIRNIDTIEFDSLLDNLITRTSRGFTGHEHLDRTGFIHMNGRVYDPTLGRFLSPDPFVQLPASSQNWNRYSYVLNSPMSLVDPSGLMFGTVLHSGVFLSEDTGSYTYTYLAGYDEGTTTEVNVSVVTGRVGIYDNEGSLVGSRFRRTLQTSIIYTRYRIPIYKTVVIPKTEYAAHTGLADTSRTVDFAFAGFDISLTEDQIETALSVIDGISTGLDVLDAATTAAAIAQQGHGANTLGQFGVRKDYSGGRIGAAIDFDTEDYLNGNATQGEIRDRQRARATGAVVGLAVAAAIYVTRGAILSRSGAVTLPRNASQLQHIFRSAPGHIANTSANRNLLLRVANNSRNFAGRNKFGNDVFASIRRDGTQAWVHTRNGVIQNGGINKIPLGPKGLCPK